MKEYFASVLSREGGGPTYRGEIDGREIIARLVARSGFPAPYDAAEAGAMEIEAERQRFQLPRPPFALAYYPDAALFFSRAGAHGVAIGQPLGLDGLLLLAVPAEALDSPDARRALALAALAAIAGPANEDGLLVEYAEDSFLLEVYRARREALKAHWAQAVHPSPERTLSAEVLACT